VQPRRWAVFTVTNDAMFASKKKEGKEEKERKKKEKEKKKEN
jgi:hypothetical protein